MSDLSAQTKGRKPAGNIFISGALFGVEILSIMGWGEVEYRGSDEELDLKEQSGNDEKIRIRYKVHGVVQNVSLRIEYDPSGVHEQFYAQYQTAKFRPPELVKLLADERKEPGEYEIEWDGRDQTSDKRLLLSGDYHLIIKGVAFGLLERSAQAGISVAKPNACNFGMHYRKKGYLETTKKETERAMASQAQLVDGTAFSSAGYLDYDAVDGVGEIRDAAVLYWSGHSGSGGINFYGREGGNYNKKYKSVLHLFGRNWKDPDASLQDQKDGIFKDLFLVMLNGCRTSSEIQIVQAILGYFNPGRADGKHGKKTTAALSKFQSLHDLAPSDGTKNEATLSWLRISSEGLSERALTLKVQRRIKRYYPGKQNGILNSRTKRAIRAYQEDHPDLAVTGELDDPTFRALKIGDRDAKSSSGKHLYLPRNIADGMGYKGADITMGFEHKIDFDLAEDWAIKFWEHLANGQGVNTAANNATALVDVRRKRQCTVHIYLQDGVSPESTLHPARYGKT